MNSEAEFQYYENLKKSFVLGRMGKNIDVDFKSNKTSKSIPGTPVINTTLNPKVKNIPLKFLSFEDMRKYNKITGSYGVEPSKVENDTVFRNSSFRDSARPYENKYISSGYMGQGTESGDIDVSTALRNEENVRKIKSKNNDLDSKDDNLSRVFVSSYSKLMDIYSKNLEIRGGMISRDDSRID